MSQQLPSFIEDPISQIPALQLLQNLGWRYLTPGETVKGTFNTQTRNHYCVNLRQFGNFLLSRSLVHKNPFANLQRVYNIEADRRIERRCVTPDELRTFLASVGASDKVRQGLDGKDRRLLYWLASVNGLRRNELGSDQERGTSSHRLHRQ